MTKTEVEAMTKTYTFLFERETKNTLVFKESALEGLEDIGTLYLQKRSDMGRAKPQSLTVTLANGAGS